MEEPHVLELDVNHYTVAAFFVYLITIVIIGVLSSRFSSKGIGHYFIGGRQMNKLVVALSAVVSGRSIWIMLGFVGIAFEMGASAIWAAAGYTIIEFFLFWFYARRLRRFSEQYKCITIPDFFDYRFNDKSGFLRILTVAVITLFMVIYVSSQFVGGGKAFAAGFQMSMEMGIILTAIIVAAYTILGGFLAVSLTDSVQAIFMILALVGLPIVAVFTEGGWTVISETLRQLDPSLLDPTALGLGAFLGLVGIGLGSPGNPQILARYMSISDTEQLKFSAVTGTITNVLLAVGALFTGLIARMHFGEVGALPGEDPENAFPLIAQHYLHPILFGAVLASIFAAIMSSADSQLLVGASGIVRDIYEKHIYRGQTIDQKHLVFLSRAIVLVLVIIALIMGFFAEQVVFWLVLFAWGGLGASIGPTSILALFWKRTTLPGVASGFITGTVVVFVWEHYKESLASVIGFELYELIPAFLLSMLMTVVVSLVTKPPEDTEEKFKSMKQPKGKNH